MNAPLGCCGWCRDSLNPRLHDILLAQHPFEGAWGGTINPLCQGYTSAGTGVELFASYVGALRISRFGLENCNPPIYNPVSLGLSSDLNKVWGLRLPKFSYRGHKFTSQLAGWE